MTKIHKQGLIFSLFLAINLFFFFYLNYTVVERLQMLISNRLYCTWNLVLQDSDLDINQISEQLPNGSRAFFEHTEDGNLRFVYQKGDWKLPLVSGHSFDSNVDLPQALVGINVKNNLENEDYIVFGDIKYEVVGILGTNYPSSLDNLTLINKINETLPIERVVIDTENPRDIENVAQLFNVSVFNENRALSRFLNSDIFKQLIMINVVIILVILIVISGYLYFNLYKKNDYVLYLLGNSKLNIMKRNIARLTVAFLSSFIMILLIDLGIGNQVVFKYFTRYILILLLIYISYCSCFFLGDKKLY